MQGYPRSIPCESPFSQLWQLFGEDKSKRRMFVQRYLPETDVRASLRFKRYLNLNPRTPRKLDVASLEAKILKDCDAWRRDPTLSTIRTGMDEQSGGDTVRQPSSATMQMLMTYAMGVENDRYATLENDMDSPNSHACRSAETSGFHAIALCIVSTATSAMISRGTAKNAKLVKLDAS
jgi:hypothetical protein